MTPNLWTLPETVHFADTDWRVTQWQHLCRRGAPPADPVRPG